MNDFLIDLCEWLKEDIWSKKILFIRNRVAGNQILRMAASHGAPAVNVTPNGHDEKAKTMVGGR